MFNLIVTSLSEIVSGLSFGSGWLSVMALIVVCMLLGSVGIIATFIACCTKVAIFQHAKEKRVAANS